ncbi:unnamed protein product [Protopolystoma xenopodis]|uniref:Uncharacterized protein n=1 Tax=Protopolystoma xenopodis TaxID=117903 RepID=A0A448XA90_9PLAT|nr:unnamed protein product [Protopolystoma xenopodis]
MALSEQISRLAQSTLAMQQGQTKQLQPQKHQRQQRQNMMPSPKLPSSVHLTRRSRQQEPTRTSGVLSLSSSAGAMPQRAGRLATLPPRMGASSGHVGPVAQRPGNRHDMAASEVAERSASLPSRGSWRYSDRGFVGEQLNSRSSDLRKRCFPH